MDMLYFSQKYYWTGLFLVLDCLGEAIF